MGLPEPKMNMAEFLTWEAQQAERHEFNRGDIFAMTGATLGHNRTIRNLSRTIEDHLGRTPCHVFSESVKVQVAEGYLYPDGVVTCAKVHPGDNFLTEPTLIFEVLSAGTQGYDPGKEFTLYRTLPTLREYLLIDPVDRETLTYTRRDRGEWVLNDQTGSATILLTSIDAALSVERVSWDSPNENPRPGPERS